MRSAVGYVRVSTPKQRLNSSFWRQSEAIEEWCATEKYDLRIIVFEVMSAFRIPFRERPGGKEALRLCDALNAFALVVEDYDRYSRCGYTDVPPVFLRGTREYF